MSNPPKQIDGANVLEWAWSGDKPFGIVMTTDGKVAAEIYGIAICKYENSDIIYRFSCDFDWETEQDSDYSSIEDAKKYIPAQYQNIEIQWKKSE